ncbi:copper amine oxidase N-terminal domain-containing protein [Aedoeadaptatus urinae]|uniref:copper amine oxidase N-terminal domain-containing protein n=1 Tax=Aedoeadaptatus urinae TaxID=1871017 RepID=UPI00097D793E|nr:copper amine oxidase N-terminal domain-containing protein [Peptoniphilus urinae]
MKKLVLILLALCFIPTLAFANGPDDDDEYPIDVYIKGVQAAMFDDFTGVEMKDNRVTLPVRVVTEGLGGKVNWNAEKRQVTLTKGDKNVVMTIGKKAYTVNGVKKTMDTVPRISKNRTYLPMRFVAEALGVKVQWDEKNRAAFFGDMEIGKKVKGETVQVYKNVTVTIPEDKKGMFLYKEEKMDDGYLRKSLYEKKNHAFDEAIGWVGCFDIADKPEGDIPCYVVGRIGNKYLIFICASDVQTSLESKELQKAYNDARKQLPEILSTVQITK